MKYEWECNECVSGPGRTVLAGSCEQVWLPRQTDNSKPHLTLALWLYCGAAGMRVWLPLFPREGESSHSFMARRIMLHFPCHNIYPLRILFEKALMLGVANDTQVSGSQTGHSKSVMKKHFLPQARNI